MSSAADLVQEVLDASGLTKAALSAKSGVSRSLLDGYLSGRTQPSIEQVDRLADAAGVRLRFDIAAPGKTRKVPESLFLVLEFGANFPVRDPKPLVNLGPVWAAARERARA